MSNTNTKSTANKVVATDKAETVVVSARDLIRRAREEYGTVETVESGIAGLDTLRDNLRTAYRGWSAVALAAKSERISGTEFAALAGVKGGNKMAFTRFVRAGRMFAAIGNKKTDPFDVRALVNGIGNGGVTAAQFDDMVATVAGGKSFAQVEKDNRPKKVEKGRKDGKGVTDGVNKPRDGKKTHTVKPSEFPAVIGIILANLHKCADVTLAELGDLATQVADAVADETTKRVESKKSA